MAQVFVLSVFSLNGEPMGEPKRLNALPIRIGRNGLNDFVIGHGGVSSFHARVEDVEGRLCVTDLASKNGVRVMSHGPVPQPLPPNQPIDLQPVGFQFFLGVHVCVRIGFEERSEPLEHRGPMSFTGQVVGNAGVMLGTPSMMPPAPATPQRSLSPSPFDSPAFGAPARPPSNPPGAGALPPMAASPGAVRAATGFLQGLTTEAMALQGLK